MGNKVASFQGGLQAGKESHVQASLSLLFPHQMEWTYQAMAGNGDRQDPEDSQKEVADPV